MENGGSDYSGHPALHPCGVSLRLFKFTPGDFVSVLPKRWINVTAPVWAAWHETSSHGRHRPLVTFCSHTEARGIDRTPEVVAEVSVGLSNR
jgi:hypothetical protein